MAHHKTRIPDQGEKNLVYRYVRTGAITHRSAYDPGNLDRHGGKSKPEIARN